jgi:hypothetical protein
MQQIDKKDGSCFFLGAVPETFKIKEQVQKGFSQCKIIFPATRLYSPKKSKQMWEAANAVQPDVICWNDRKNVKMAHHKEQPMLIFMFHWFYLILCRDRKTAFPVLDTKV